MKARVLESYPGELLKGKEVTVRNCRATDEEAELYQYLIHYQKPGMAINKWIEAKHLNFNQRSLRVLFYLEVKNPWRHGEENPNLQRSKF